MKITNNIDLYFYNKYIGFWHFRNWFVRILYLGFVIVVWNKNQGE